MAKLAKKTTSNPSPDREVTGCVQKGGQTVGGAQLKTTMADQADTRPKKKLMCSLI